MLNELKQSIYTLLTSLLHYVVVDYPYDNNTDITYPFIRLELTNVTKDVYKNAFRNSYIFSLHIFSDYDGEKEIFDMEENIFNTLQNLYNIDGVIYVRESGFRVFNDKSTGLNRKHGVLTINIITSGTYQEGE